MIKAGHYLV